jgi:hypothetical protein
MLLRLRQRALHRRSLSDITRNCERFATARPRCCNFRRHSIQGLSPATSDGHLRTLPRERQGARPADAGSSTSNERHFA